MASSFETPLLARVAARAWHVRDPRDRDVDRPRLLRPAAPHGERRVARHDDFYRGAGHRAVAGSSGDVVDAVAWHLHRLDGLWRVGADLERGADVPETLLEADRKSLAFFDVLGAFRQTVTNRQTLGYALAAGGVQGSLFAFVFASQQVFTEIYGLGHYFPLAFAAVAIGIAIAGFLNARFVGRIGMRVISHGALVGYVVVAAIMLVAAKLHMLPLPLFMTLSAMMMFAFGLTFANFTALAMEPQGHIAGTASSLYGSITTLLGIGIGTTIGQAYDGTLLPFATGFFLCTLGSLAAVLVTEKGRLFKPHARLV